MAALQQVATQRGAHAAGAQDGNLAGVGEREVILMLAFSSSGEKRVHLPPPYGEGNVKNNATRCCPARESAAALFDSAPLIVRARTRCSRALALTLRGAMMAAHEHFDCSTREARLAAWRARRGAAEESAGRASSVGRAPRRKTGALPR